MFLAVLKKTPHLRTALKTLQLREIRKFCSDGPVIGQTLQLREMRKFCKMVQS